MKLVRLCVLFLCLAAKGWGDFPEHVLESWNNVEKSFSGTKYLSILVLNQNEEPSDAIQQVVFDVFKSHNQSFASEEESVLEDSQLGIFIVRENGINTVTILLHILFDEEPELFFVDCFSVDDENILQNIAIKISSMVLDMVQGGGSFKIFIAE